MKTDSKRRLAAACVVGLCVTGILFIHRPPGPKQIALVESPETIQQTDLEPLTQPSEPLLPRPQPSLSHLPAAPAIAPTEPPEDPDEAREWARKNPHDALTWMLNAPSGEPRDTVVEIVCAHMAESNPAEAVSLAERYSGARKSVCHQQTAWRRTRPSAQSRGIHPFQRKSRRGRKARRRMDFGGTSSERSRSQRAAPMGLARPGRSAGVGAVVSRGQPSQPRFDRNREHFLTAIAMNAAKHGHSSPKQQRHKSWQSPATKLVSSGTELSQSLFTLAPDF